MCHMAYMQALPFNTLPAVPFSCSFRKRLAWKWLRTWFYLISNLKMLHACPVFRISDIFQPSFYMPSLYTLCKWVKGHLTVKLAISLTGCFVLFYLFCNWYVVSIVCMCQWPTRKPSIYYFGHRAHFILANRNIAINISFLFFNWFTV